MQLFTTNAKTGNQCENNVLLKNLYSKTLTLTTNVQIFHTLVSASSKREFKVMGKYDGDIIDNYLDLIEMFLMFLTSLNTFTI